jgi:acetylornithine deacetylase/succinyl-diaminopimelate desuccinylase-like protein
MSAPFVLRTRGRSGHASMPHIGDNALLKAAPLIEKLGAFEPEPRHIPETEGFFRVVLGEVPEPREAYRRLRELDEQLAGVMLALFAPTFAPTMASASLRRNVIPAVCEVTVDSRLLPGQTPDDSAAMVRDVLGDGDYELEWIEASGGTRSPIESPLYEAIESWVAEVDPEAAVAPLCVPGFTDSHWMREAFGTVAYGFFPMRAMPADLATLLVHSANERARVDDLELGVDFYRYAARALLS